MKTIPPPSKDEPLQVVCKGQDEWRLLFDFFWYRHP